MPTYTGTAHDELGQTFNFTFTVTAADLPTVTPHPPTTPQPHGVPVTVPFDETGGPLTFTDLTCDAPGGTIEVQGQSFVVTFP